MRLASILLALPLAVACAATPTAYAPSSGGRDVGYRDMRIQENRWRVTFTGGSDVSEGRVHDLALRRAAEVTLDAGFDWFDVVGRSGDQSGTQRSPVSTGVSVGRSWGSGGWSGTSTGVGVSFAPGQERRLTTTLEIIAGQGPAPERAYDARAILDNIRP